MAHGALLAVVLLFRHYDEAHQLIQNSQYGSLKFNIDVCWSVSVSKVTAP